MLLHICLVHQVEWHPQWNEVRMGSWFVSSQEALEALPDHLVVEICKNILHTCKNMWPDLDYKLQMAGATQCHLSAGKIIS